MKNSIVAVLMFSLLSLAAPAGAFPPGGSGDCQSCHKLEKKEAEELAKSMARRKAKQAKVAAAPPSD